MGTELSAALFEQADKLKAEGKIRSFGICGPAGSVGLLKGQQKIDIIQMPLCDVLSTPPSGKRSAAYGLYTEFKRTGRGATFKSFVNSLARQHTTLELILSTTSVMTLSQFAQFFHE